MNSKKWKQKSNVHRSWCNYLTGTHYTGLCLQCFSPLFLLFGYVFALDFNNQLFQKLFLHNLLRRICFLRILLCCYFLNFWPCPARTNEIIIKANTTSHSQLEWHFHSVKNRLKCFSFTLCRRNLKTQQSPVIYDLCLRKHDWLRKENDMNIVTTSFLKAPFSKCCPPHPTVHAPSCYDKLEMVRTNFCKVCLPFWWLLAIWPPFNTSSLFSGSISCTREGTLSHVLINKLINNKSTVLKKKCPFNI